jgi:CBS-domain-containing membrane protein
VKPINAVGEDLRRVGVALIVTGLVAGFLEDRVLPVTAAVSSAIGVVLLIVGYWAHHHGHTRSEES